MSDSNAITQNDIKNIMETFLPSIDLFYPVGAYYETSDINFDPNETWTGVWELETEGQIHVSGSVSGTYKVNGALTNTSDGGEKTHVLTPGETALKAHTHTMAHTHNMNSHTHDMGNLFSNGSGSSSAYTMVSNKKVISKNTGGSSAANTGNASMTSGGLTEANGSAHNNMQPYIIVNRWHRIA